MSAAIEIAAAAALLLGGALTLIAGLGLARLEDVFMRMHAATKTGTLGLALIVLGLLAGAEDLSKAIKAIAIVAFMLTTLPIAAHLVGRAVYRNMSRRERDAARPDDAGG